TTTIVQGGGAALQLAVQAAQPGDTLDVLSGNYTAVTVDKGITVACRSGVVISSGPGYAVTVNNLPAFTTFVLAGAQLDAFRIDGCAGGVVFDRVTNVSPIRGANINGAVIRSSCDGPPYLHAYAPGPAIVTTGGAIRLDPSVQLV